MFFNKTQVREIVKDKTNEERLESLIRRFVYVSRDIDSKVPSFPGLYSERRFELYIEFLENELKQEAEYEKVKAMVQKAMTELATSNKS